MKKLLTILVALAMLLSIVSFASAEGYDGEIKIWVAENVVEFTKEQVENFKANEVVSDSRSTASVIFANSVNLEENHIHIDTLNIGDQVENKFT